MKAIKSFAVIGLMMFAFSASALAQISATATASATIVGPIGITNGGNMSFGNVAVNNVAGTVLLPSVGARSVTGGCTLPAVTGSPAAAIFNVTGAANYTYAITLPSTPTTISSGANNMTVDAFTSTPTNTGTLDGTGAQQITVGATLHVSANQAAGTYTSATPFSVTVNYN
jgi:hypothetical protein